MSAPREAPGLDAEAFRDLAHRAVDLLADRMAARPETPVYAPMSAGARRALLEDELPEEGRAPAEILARFGAQVLPYPMGNDHPRFFGWVNSAPAPLGVIAELLAAGMNPSCAGGDHAGVHLEHAVVRWLAELVGFPLHGDGAAGEPRAGAGLLTSGGSMASLHGLAAMRHQAVRRLGGDVRARGLAGLPPLAVYASAEGHSCLRKSLELLGLAGAHRPVPVDRDQRLDVACLQAAIAADRAAGRVPIAVCASAGTVNTGAVDPLEELADLCAEQELWLHVDGAYGAVGAAVPALAAHYVGLGRVDSLALDPHKWLSVPVECGCALVRDGGLLRETFSLVPAYLRSEEGKGFGGAPWISEYGFQQTRGFRALKLWMTLQHMGRAGVERMIARHVELAHDLAGRIAATPGLELAAAVTLSIVAFRHLPEPALEGAALDAHQRRIAERVQEAGRAFLTWTEVDGRAVLRACILHHETSEADLEVLVREVLAAGVGFPP